MYREDLSYKYVRVNLPWEQFSCGTNARELLIDALKNEIDQLKNHLP